MAGGKFSEALLYGMTIRESANDGSDFSNPAADYRRMFVGEDGLFHLKDSAGTVTTPAFGNPMTTAGDVIYGGASGVATRLAIGTAGKVLTVNAGATAPEWATAGGGGGFAQSATATRTAGDLTTSSTTYVDATGLTVTLTTGATRCLVIFNGNAIVTSTAAGSIDVAVDGTRMGQAYGSAIFQGSGASRSVSFTLLTSVLSAASHTIKIQWKVDNGAATGTLYASTTVSAATITVLETNLTV